MSVIAHMHIRTRTTNAEHDENAMVQVKKHRISCYAAVVLSRATQ